MKIHEIIRKKRMEKGYTQEQVASLLGVSAPAVNKWEKAASYPDITLLPALARLLDTDLNTLLSFQEELTKEEISAFLNELAAAADAEGIDTAFHMATCKLHEYPSCDILLLNTALTLEGLTILNENKSSIYQEYADTIEEMYRRAALSRDSQVSSYAKAMLISKHIAKKEFDAAEKLLDELPDAASYSKTQLQSTLYREQGRQNQAAQLIEQDILTKASNIYSSLFALAEIAIKEEQMKDARQLIDIAKQTAALFDLWICSNYIADFLLYAAQKDTDGCLESLEKMLPALEKEWKPKPSPLYRHTPLNGTTIGQRMLPGILNELEDPENHEYDFLRKDPKVQELLQKYYDANVKKSCNSCLHE